MALEYIHSGKHIGNPVFKTIVEMSNEMDLMTKKDMSKYIKDRNSDKIYFIQKPDGNVLTLSERRIRNTLTPMLIMGYFSLVLHMPLETDYNLIDPDGNILDWTSSIPILHGILYKVVHKDITKIRNSTNSKLSSNNKSSNRKLSNSKLSNRTKGFMFKTRRKSRTARKSKKVRKSNRKSRTTRKSKKVRKSRR